MQWPVALAVLAVGLIPTAAIAADTGNCAESNTMNRFEGRSKVLATMAGAEAILESQALNICTPNPTDNNRANHVFVGVDGNDGLDFDIVQMGMVNCQNNPNPDCGPGDGTHRFWAWGRDSDADGCATFSDVAPSPQLYGAFPGAPKAYTVVRTATQWQFKFDSITGQSIPVGFICWAPKRALFTGESWDIKDAIGGPIGNPYRLWSAKYEQNVGGVWSNTAWGAGDVCNVAPTDPRYKCNAINGTTLDLWTVQP